MQIKRRTRRDPRILLLALAALLFFGNMIFTASTPVLGDQGQIVVEIPKGASFDQVAGILAEEGVIHSKLLFKVKAKLKGWDNAIQAGTYVIKKGETEADLLQKMHNGETMATGIRFTVPEGYTVKQIAALLDKKGVISEADFLKAVKTYKPEGMHLPDTAYPFEGYLFPDTYEVEPGTSGEEIIKMMVHRFFKTADPSYREKLAQKGLNLQEAVTLASIVEREAKAAEERPIIAGVFLKRLAIGMPLQSCATVQFLLPEQKKNLTYKDLKIDSPYNTYRHKGLPPGPIGNPGAASLKAVVEAKDEGYLYFVSKNDGTHVFSRTLAEHDKAKEKYQ